MSLTIKRPEKVVPLCLDASLQAEWEKAEADLIASRKGIQDDRLGARPVWVDLAEKVQSIEAAMLAEVVHVRLRALPRSEWASALAAHPPKPNDPVDKEFGADKAAFFDDVIGRSIVAVTRAGEPVDFDPAGWPALADEMTDRQWSDFADAVYILNRGAVSVPFSRAASSLNRASSGTSEPPAIVA